MNFAPSAAFLLLVFHRFSRVASNPVMYASVQQGRMPFFPLQNISSGNSFTNCVKQLNGREREGERSSKGWKKVLTSGCGYVLLLPKFYGLPSPDLYIYIWIYWFLLIFNLTILHSTSHKSLPSISSSRLIFVCHSNVLKTHFTTSLFSFHGVNILGLLLSLLCFVWNSNLPDLTNHSLVALRNLIRKIPGEKGKSIEHGDRRATNSPVPVWD